MSGLQELLRRQGSDDTYTLPRMEALLDQQVLDSLLVPATDNCCCCCWVVLGKRQSQRSMLQLTQNGNSCKEGSPGNPPGNHAYPAMLTLAAVCGGPCSAQSFQATACGIQGVLGWGPPSQ
jgi:hypothetical protein